MAVATTAASSMPSFAEHRRNSPKTPSSPLLSAGFAGASFGLMNTSSQNFAAAKSSSQKVGGLVRSSSMGSTTAGGSLSSSDPWGRESSALRCCKKTAPLLIRVPRRYEESWPFERERATLLSLKAEHIVLQKENRSLISEIGRLCRQAKGRLTMQKAEATARQVELKHLQQLAEEARRLLELKESMENESATGGLHEDGRPSPEEELEQAHAALIHRLRWLRAHEHANGISNRRHSGGSSSGSWFDDPDEGMLTIRTAPGDALGSLNSTCTSFSQYSASAGRPDNGYNSRSNSIPMSVEQAAATALRRPRRPSTTPGTVDY